MSRRGLLALSGVVAAAALLTLFVPTPLWGPRLLGVVCTQRLDHALVLGGVPLPTSARCVGVYDGAGLGYLLVLVLGRGLGRRLPGLGVCTVLGVLVLAMGLDGVNSTLEDLAGARLYPTTVETRLLSGLGFGLALALLSYPVLVGLVFGRDAEALSPAEDLTELAGYLAVVAAFGALATTRPAWLLYPAALITVLGELAVFGLLNWMVLAALRWPRDRSRAAALAMLLAVGELTTLALVLRSASGQPGLA